MRRAGTAMLGMALLPLAAAAHDYPTNARVEYVMACMESEPKLERREAMYKCSCAIDAIAETLTYDQWVEVSTIANAITIAGERGGAVRDLKDSRPTAARYRALQEEARKRCFLAR